MIFPEMWFSRRARNEINRRRWWDLLQKGGNFFIRTQYKSGTWQIKKDIVVLTTCMTGADRTVRNTEGWLDFLNTNMTNNTVIYLRNFDLKRNWLMEATQITIESLWNMTRQLCGINIYQNLSTLVYSCWIALISYTTGSSAKKNVLNWIQC